MTMAREVAGLPQADDWDCGLGKLKDRLKHHPELLSAAFGVEKEKGDVFMDSITAQFDRLEQIQERLEYDKINYPTADDAVRHRLRYDVESCWWGKSFRKLDCHSRLIICQFYCGILFERGPSPPIRALLVHRPTTTPTLFTQCSPSNQPGTYTRQISILSFIGTCERSGANSWRLWHSIYLLVPGTMLNRRHLPPMGRGCWFKITMLLSPCSVSSLLSWSIRGTTSSLQLVYKHHPGRLTHHLAST